MNTPAPVSTVNVPAVTPTLGAIVGGIVATAVTSHVGSDPMTIGFTSSAISTLFAWLFHFAHSKLGTPE